MVTDSPSTVPHTHAGRDEPSIVAVPPEPSIVAAPPEASVVTAPPSTREIAPASRDLTTAEVYDPTTRLRAVIGRLSRRLRPTVAGSGLTPSQTSILFTVARLGPLGLSEVSEIEGINPTMLSRITAQLCQAGLIKRESHPDDRRAAFVRVTPAGQRLRKRIHRERTEALQEHIAKLTEEQRELLWNALPALETLAELIPGHRS